MKTTEDPVRVITESSRTRDERRWKSDIVPLLDYDQCSSGCTPRC